MEVTILGQVAETEIQNDNDLCSRLEFPCPSSSIIDVQYIMITTAEMNAKAFRAVFASLSWSKGLSHWLQSGGGLESRPERFAAFIRAILTTPHHRPYTS